MAEGMIARLNAALVDRYRIERELGAGGMATVYLADDLRHDRKVALKVLKPELAAVVGGERFLTEIRTTANLQHPHILPLFDSGTAGGFLFYVMPYVEGESLRERLDREKQLPVDEAVAIARKVAGALDYAHRHDIIHRDIKPANILLHDGEPVVADFGIALAVQEAGAGRLTETGLSLGTPYYMSPEQATADRDPSAASDVYSLACVLYEMLTGEPPFTGTTAQAVLGRILTAEVRPPTEQRKAIPPHVEDVVLQALEKLPADRFRSAADFAEALGDPGRVTARRSGRAAPPGRAPALPWVLLVGALAALAVTLASRPAGEATVVPTVRAILELPAGEVLSRPILDISEDGRRIVVTGTHDGVEGILTKELSEDGFTALLDTEGAELPFLSPDGSDVMYRGGAALRRMSTEGGPSTVVDPDAAWGLGDWLEDGTIFYPRSYISGLWVMRPDESPEQLTQPDSLELAHWHPQLLPDGRSLLFTAFRTPIDSARIDVLDLETGERRTVHTGGVFGRYVPTGHLLFARDNRIFAVAMDIETLETSGAPVLVLEDVAMSFVDGAAGFAVSDDGTAVYIEHSEFEAPADLVWIDRDGDRTPVVPEAAGWSSPSLSPDGRRIAVTVVEPGEPQDVMVLDPVRGTRTPLTFGGGADFQPVWSPDGTHVIYSSERPVFDLFRVRADGTGGPEPLAVGPLDKYAVSFTPDGSHLLYEESSPSGQTIRTLSYAEPRSSEALETGSEAELNPRVSPDGRWLVYTSEISGRPEVYIATWPGLTGRQVVSVDGGEQPYWTKGGREIVYRHGQDVVAVSVDPETAELGTPEVLFGAPALYPSLESVSYDVTPDGERFLMVVRPVERSPRRVVVITGFFEELRRRMGG